MHAYVLHGVDDLRYEQADMPELKPGWVLVKVMAAGICGSDIPRIFETGTYHFPTIPGHEFSGVVEKIAEEDKGNCQTEAWLNKRVGVFPLIPCGKCAQCLAEQYEMCSDYDYLGSRRDGGFAEYAAVPVWNLIELPDTVDFAEAAMLEPMAVARHALRQISLTETKSIVIYGIGTIGLLMAQWARIYGINEILLVGNKEGQAELAKKLGFEKICNQKDQNAKAWIEQMTAGKMADAAIEGVGRDAVFAQCIESVRPKGTVILVGNPHGDVQLEKTVYWKILRKQLRVFGTWNSSFHTSKEDDWKAAVEMLSEDRIDAMSLVTHNYPFEELMEGLKVMRNKSEFYSKILVENTY